MTSARAEVDRSHASFGLAGWHGRPGAMRVAHCHNDIELNMVVAGEATYEFGGERVGLRAGELCLFWAARPHQLQVDDGGLELSWVTLPLALFLSWGLPAQISAPLLGGRPIVWAGGRPDLRRWVADLSLGGPERERIVRLELEAALRRAALEHDPGAGHMAGAKPPGHAARMAQIMAARYSEPLSVAAVAAEAGLHPHYAMQVFRAAYGMSILEYLTRHRVAHAQMLLATTDMGVLDVGMAAGFASASRFHSAFKAACGCTPGAYRKRP